MHDAEAERTSSQAEPQGRLTVTASVLFGRRYVAPIVSAFILRNRHVNVEMLFVDRVVNMVEEGIDVAIRMGHLKDSSFARIGFAGMLRFSGIFFGEQSMGCKSYNSSRGEEAISAPE